MISMPTKNIYLYPNAPCEKTMEEMDIPNMPYYKDPLLDNSTFLLSFNLIPYP